MSRSADIIVSLTECGWLTGWSRSLVFSGDKTLTSERLRLWRINTKHETPIISFKMNQSRIVSVERHQMTSEWDKRMMMVVRDFWRYNSNNKKQSRKTSAREVKDHSKKKLRKK